MNAHRTRTGENEDRAAAVPKRSRPSPAQRVTAVFCFVIALGLVMILLAAPTLEGVWAVAVAATAFVAAGVIKLRPRVDRPGPDLTVTAATPAPARAGGTAPSAAPAQNARGQREWRWTSGVAVTVLVAATVAGVMIALLIGGGAAPVPVEDPGAAVRWGLPLVKAAQTAAAAVSIGALVLASVALPSGVRAHDRAMDVAAVAAGAWTVLAAMSLFLAFFSLVPGSLTSSDFSANLAFFAASISLGQAWVLTTLIAATVTVACLLVRSPLMVTAVALLALGGLAPMAFTGHAAGSTDHSTAVTAIGLHVLGASVWLGALVVLVLLRQTLGDRAAAVVSRYSTVALLCFFTVVASGVVSATLRVSALDQLASPYGAVLLMKSGLLLGLGVAGAVQRRRLIQGLRTGGGTSRPFWLLVISELLLLGIASGLGTGLARTPPPTEVAELPGQTASELLTGRPAPPELSLTALAGQWNGNLLWVLVCAFALVVYLGGVRRVTATSARWPVGRTISWCAGVVLFLITTNGAPAVYRDYLFSINAVTVLLLTLPVPLLLLLARPATLLTAAVRPREDGSRGGREWLAAARSSIVLRFLGQPVVGAVAAGLSLVGYFLTPVLEWSLQDRIGRDIITAYFLVVGIVLARALSRPGVSKESIPVNTRVLAILVFTVLLACLAAVLAVRPSLLAPDWYGALDQPWGPPAFEDQESSALWITAVAVFFLLSHGWFLLRHRRRNQGA